MPNRFSTFFEASLSSATDASTSPSSLASGATFSSASLERFGVGFLFGFRAFVFDPFFDLEFGDLDRLFGLLQGLREAFRGVGEFAPVGGEFGFPWPPATASSTSDSSR